MKRPSSTRPALRKPLILVVNHNLDITRELCCVLDEHGYATVQANDVRTAFADFANEKPDLVLLDLAPYARGMEVLRRVRLEDARTPVVLFSRLYDVRDAIEAFQLGASGFLNTVTGFSRLVPIVQRLLHESTQEPDAAPLSELVKLLLNENERLTRQSVKLEGRRDAAVGQDPGAPDSQLRALVHGLQGMISLIASEVELIDRNQDEAKEIPRSLGAIRSTLTEIDAALRQLRSYRPSGRSDFQTLSAREVLLEAESRFRGWLPDGVSLNVQVALHQEGATVRARGDALAAVLRELVRNAVGALRHRGGQVMLGLREAVGAVALTVADDGPGIPDEIRKSLFKGVVPSEKGWGMGLLICNEEVEAMGGKMEIETSSRGTTVTIILPAVEEDTSGANHADTAG